MSGPVSENGRPSLDTEAVSPEASYGEIKVCFSAQAVKLESHPWYFLGGRLHARPKLPGAADHPQHLGSGGHRQGKVLGDTRIS